MIDTNVSHYRVLEQLEGGGMAEVYKAQDLKLPRFVALKFLKADLHAKLEERKRFMQEAVAITKLDHSNICTIYEIGETESGQMFIAMAYYDGGSLKGRIKPEGLPALEAVNIAIQIAQGLAKAHERGIIHRDLKPANVMFTADGIAKVVDFGLAKLADAQRLTPTSTTVGTPAYMSPEQARMLEVDARSDIWSLGIILYEMLAGRIPFRGEYYLELMYAVVHEEPQPLQTHVAGLPPRLYSIVERALAKPLEDRYASMNDMLQDLLELKNALETNAGSEKAILRRNGALPADFALKLRRLIEDKLVLAEAPMPRSAENPYLNRVKIQNPDEFYGRSAELSRIYERIKAGRPQSVSLVGVRRIGKSSLLSAIHHPRNRVKYLPAPQEYVFAKMDLQEKRNVEPAELLQYIFAALQEEFSGQLKLEIKPDYEGLKEVVHAFQDAGLKLIFLWDEFECVTRNPKVGPEFYAYFRALANNFNVAYLTTSSAQLQSLCHTKEIADSPFFNIFTNLHLGPFKLEEAKQLIAEPSARAGKPLAEHTDFVLELAGQFPIFIQMVCAALFSGDTHEKSAFKKMKEAFWEEAEPHFQEYWEKFEESEKAVVAALARNKKPPREHAFAMKDLAQAGFVLNGKLFSTVFAEFVRETARRPGRWWQRWG